MRYVKRVDIQIHLQMQLPFQQPIMTKGLADMNDRRTFRWPVRMA